MAYYSVLGVEQVNLNFSEWLLEKSFFLLHEQTKIQITAIDEAAAIGRLDILHLMCHCPMESVVFV